MYVDKYLRLFGLLSQSIGDGVAYLFSHRSGVQDCAAAVWEFGAGFRLHRWPSFKCVLTWQSKGTPGSCL